MPPDTQTKLVSIQTKPSNFRPQNQVNSDRYSEIN